MTPAGTVRVGHSEREHVVHVLMQQYSEGRLTPGELDDRSARARAARTVADLDGLVSDLPVPPPSVELRRIAATADLARVGTDPNHRQTMTAGVSAYVRRGVWTVPAYLHLTAGLSTVKLDFQQAICHHSVVDIVVSAGVGTVVLILPEGWGANTDQVTKGIGSVSNKVDAVPRPGKPLLVLQGSSFAGSVRVRYAGAMDRRLMRRNQRRGLHQEDPGAASSYASPNPHSAGPQDSPSWDVGDRRY